VNTGVIYASTADNQIAAFELKAPPSKPNNHECKILGKFKPLFKEEPKDIIIANTKGSLLLQDDRGNILIYNTTRMGDMISGRQKPLYYQPNYLVQEGPSVQIPSLQIRDSKSGFGYQIASNYLLMRVPKEAA